MSSELPPEQNGINDHNITAVECFCAFAMPELRGVAGKLGKALRVIDNRPKLPV